MPVSLMPSGWLTTTVSRASGEDSSSVSCPLILIAVIRTSSKEVVFSLRLLAPPSGTVAAVNPWSQKRATRGADGWFLFEDFASWNGVPRAHFFGPKIRFHHLLVGILEQFFLMYLGIIIPTDFHIFQR